LKKTFHLLYKFIITVEETALQKGTVMYSYVEMRRKTIYWKKSENILNIMRCTKIQVQEPFVEICFYPVQESSS